ncbi:MAG: hypothetical protein BRD25_02205, partial [Bacteroidetes bacterium QH_1_61_8]
MPLDFNLNSQVGRRVPPASPSAMRVARRSSMIMMGLLALILGGGGAVIGHEVTPVGPVLGLVPAVVVLVVGLRRP